MADERKLRPSLAITDFGRAHLMQYGGMLCWFIAVEVRGVEGRVLIRTDEQTVVELSWLIPKIKTGSLWSPDLEQMAAPDPASQTSEPGPKLQPISWVCPTCKAEGNRETIACPSCNGAVQPTGRVLKDPATGRVRWGSDGGCDCGALPGVLFPWDSDIGHAGVERCDSCAIYQYDDDAGQALGQYLAWLYPGKYEIRRYQVFADPNAAGAMRIAVFRTGDAVPLTFEEGMALAKRIDLIEKPKSGAS